MDRQCCVVIPIYTTNLENYEWVALKNNRRVLNNYPFIAVAPFGLDLTPVTDVIDIDSVKYFDASFFESPLTYNKLLIQEAFWKMFSDFQYMLIVQQDVLLFRDELSYWCNKGFDYIGAPWLNGFGGNNQIPVEQMPNFFGCSELEARALHIYLKKVGVIDENNVIQDDGKHRYEGIPSPVKQFTTEKIKETIENIKFLYHRFVGVGNGGLSLRKISTVLAVYRSGIVPHSFNLNVKDIEKFPMMENDLILLKEHSQVFHDECRKIFRKIATWETDSPYLAVFKDVLGSYDPLRQEDLFRLVEVVKRIAVTNKDMKPLSDLLVKKPNELLQKFVRDMIIPEDFFWSLIAPLFYKKYQVAPIDEALKFSFECNPRFCYESNNKSLPFGTHAWQLPENVQFWETIPEVQRIFGKA